MLCEQINRQIQRVIQSYIREVVTLKIWEDFTFREISQILRISPDTCASRYRYGLEKLGGELKI